jgi:hypothetical protein
MGAEIRLSTQRSILKTDTQCRIIPVSILPGEFNPHRAQARRDLVARVSAKRAPGDFRHSIRVRFAYQGYVTDADRLGMGDAADDAEQQRQQARHR